MDIQTFIYLENEQNHVSITEQDRIQVYIQQKEDWLEDGFLNLDGTISFTRMESYKEPITQTNLHHCGSTMQML